MKMNRLLYILAAIACVSFFSCTKDKGDDAGEDTTPEEEPGDPIKASFPDEGLLSFLTWGEEDNLTVNGSSSLIASGAGEKNAVFEGTQKADSYYSIGYPGEIYNVSDFLKFNYEDSDAPVPVSVFIEDVTTCRDIVLSKEWAESNGGRFRSSGVVELSLSVPANIGEVKKVVLDGGGARFPADNAGNTFRSKISRRLEGETPQNGKLKVYITVPEKECTLPAGRLRITVAGDFTYSTTVPESVTMGGSRKTEISIDNASVWEAASAVSGEGTEDEPYILTSAEDLVAMHELLLEDKTVWFELDRDIDMSGVENWMPLNINSLKLYINFDGKDHTISNFSCKDMKYTSFFGALVGTVQNVTFDKADCRHSTASGKYTLGILGGYAGTTGGLKAEVKNVHVTNSTVVSPTNYSEPLPIGGLFGIMVNASVTDCSFEGSVEASGRYIGGIVGRMGVGNTLERCYVNGTISGGHRMVGGIVGGMVSNGCAIRNCWSAGSVTCTSDQDAGGIVGSMLSQQTVSCCYSTAAITAQRTAGGIVARACNDSWAYSDSFANTVEKCIAWNSSVKALEEGDSSSKGSSGAVIGFTSVQNTLTSCYRNPAMEFQGSDHTNNLLVDQPDCSPSAPFSSSTPGLYGKYCWPYHGKAAAADATVSSIAKELGWDENVWDLSADLPKLKSL